jgi:hypothetical protein
MSTALTNAAPLKANIRLAQAVSLVDNDFVVAVQQSEPMALLIVMYWGVLMHRAANDVMQWMLMSAGLSSQIIDVPRVLEGIIWTRQQVNLPRLPNLLIASLEE